MLRNAILSLIVRTTLKNQNNLKHAIRIFDINNSKHLYDNNFDIEYFENILMICLYPNKYMNLSIIYQIKI